MAARRRDQRDTPERPDLPRELAPAPAEVRNGDRWEGVAADESLALPERLHDLELIECVWRGVEAISCRLPGLVCRDVVFEGCDLSGAVLDGARLTRVRFVDCRLTGTVFGGAEIADVTIERAVARLANFRGVQAALLWIRDTSLREADFYDARLRRSALLDCDLTAASFTAARLEHLSLHGSTLEGLRGASSFAGADVRIDADQAVPLGLAALADLGVAVTDRPAAAR